MRSFINGRVVLGWLLMGLNGISSAATFGSIVQIRGHVADIALDQGRGVVYAANLTANRIEVGSMKDNSLKSAIQVGLQPDTVALSPDGRYLVVGHYHYPDAASGLPSAPCDGRDSQTPVLTVIDLANSARQTRLDGGGACVLAVAFGNSPQALVVFTDGVRRLDPASGTLTPLLLTNFASDVGRNVCVGQQRIDSAAVRFTDSDQRAVAIRPDWHRIPGGAQLRRSHRSLPVSYTH